MAAYGGKLQRHRRAEQPARRPVCPYSECLEPLVGCGGPYTPDLWLEDGEIYICPKCQQRSVQKNGGLIHEEHAH